MANVNVNELPATLTLEDIERGLVALQKPRGITRKGARITLPPAVVVEGADNARRVYSTGLYRAEQEIAQHLRRLQGSAPAAPLTIPEHAFGAFTPDASQQQAIDAAAASPILILSGRPGSGKTTVAKAIITTYEAAGLVVKCCAPTGKAALRVVEQTGRPADTIHSTLEMRPGARPKRNTATPLVAGAVVVDEASMIDVRLFADLVAAIPSGARLLVIGDVDQLPSIGPGQVLADLLTSGAFPAVRLTEIHRQATESRIPYVCRDIAEGRVPDLSPLADFAHWETSEEWATADRIVRAVCDELPARKGFTHDQIQVVAAQYGEPKSRNPDADYSPVGIVVLNRAIQNRLNPQDPTVGAEHDVFVGRGYSVRDKDRVVVTRNNRQLGVANGEVGRVVEANPRGLRPSAYLSATWSVAKTAADVSADDLVLDDNAGDNAAVRRADAPPPGVIENDDGELVFKDARVLAVDFSSPSGSKVVLFTKDEVKQIELAYCLSGHKVQGSGFPCTVVAVPAAHRYMLTRRWLYTAISRAEKFCLLIGEAAMVAQAVRNTRGAFRRTSLLDRLNQTPIPTLYLRSGNDFAGVSVDAAATADAADAGDLEEFAGDVVDGDGVEGSVFTSLSLPKLS